jgi:AcrR family transcriptional regulator
MAQVLKPEVRERIAAAALATFAERGYAAASMAAIARRAGTATANVYRYFPDKAALFAAVVPRELADRHDALLDARVAALAGAAPGADGTDGAAEELLEFWTAHRLEVAILLDRAAGTPYEDYPERFVRRLAGHVERHVAAPLADHHRRLVELVFDNTRRAVARILRDHAEPGAIRTAIAGFWSYQVPGLDGLVAWIARDAS